MISYISLCFIHGFSAQVGPKVSAVRRMRNCQQLWTYINVVAVARNPSIVVLPSYTCRGAANGMQSKNKLMPRWEKIKALTACWLVWNCAIGFLLPDMSCLFEVSFIYVFFPFFGRTPGCVPRCGNYSICFLTFVPLLVVAVIPGFNVLVNCCDSVAPLWMPLNWFGLLYKTSLFC